MPAAVFVIKTTGIAGGIMKVLIMSIDYLTICLDL